MDRLKKNLEQTLRKYAGPLYRLLQRYSGQRLVKRFTNSEDRFRHFYETNHWNEIESVSGPGSTLEETKWLRERLRKMFHKLEVPLTNCTTQDINITFRLDAPGGAAAGGTQTP